MIGAARTIHGVWAAVGDGTRSVGLLILDPTMSLQGQGRSVGIGLAAFR